MTDGQTGGRADGQHSPALVRIDAATDDIRPLVDPSPAVVLIGSGAGNAAIVRYAGSVEDHRIWGLALVAPRFVDGATDVRDELGYIRVPILILQTAAQGTAQADIAHEECYCPVDVVTTDGTDAAVSAAIADFAARLGVTRAGAERA